jgi:hypothetical protein
VVHLKGYGFIKVFRPVSEDGDEQYGATDDLQMDEATREELEGQGRGDRGISSGDQAELRD